MPRDGTATRSRLVREAERHFARHGVYQARVREITESAGQRNSSALSYHFGSREGILQEILRRHGEPLDQQRGDLVVEPIEAMPTAALVRALLIPLAGELATAEGRDYLRIVAQLTDRFPAWHVDGYEPATGKHLQRILQDIERRAGSDVRAVRRERVVNIIMLMTVAMAERARAIEHGARPKLDQDAFLANLTDVIVGGLEAKQAS